MSWTDYHHSRQLSEMGFSFTSLIFAAMRRADVDEYNALQEAFPGLAEEFDRRYDSEGGYLSPEEDQLREQVRMTTRRFGDASPS